MEKKKGFENLIRIFVCLLAAGLTLFAYIEKQNEVTELRLAIPQLTKEVAAIREDNIQLKYEIETFESPLHLMELMRSPEFSHLKFPYIDQEIFITQERIPNEK